jgi:hypothetical protein
MAVCPKCKTELDNPTKNWNFSNYVVYAYECPKCNTHFRDYMKDGEFIFSLAREEDGRFRKAGRPSSYQPKIINRKS